MIGAILIGGRSRRMAGRDKTLLQRDGNGVVERLALLLNGLCGPVLLVARDEAQAHEYPCIAGCEIVSDEVPGAGPLGGLVTALQHSGDDVLLLACDLPFVEASLITRLTTEFTMRQPSALLPRTHFAEPLCAVWSRGCLGAARHAIAQQRLAMKDFAIEVNAAYLTLSADEARQLRNINTPEDITAAELDMPK